MYDFAHFWVFRGPSIASSMLMGSRKPWLKTPFWLQNFFLGGAIKSGIPIHEAAKALCTQNGVAIGNVIANGSGLRVLTLAVFTP